MGKIANTIIIDTHFSEETMKTNAFNLSDICVNEGKKGRWFTEFSENQDKEMIEKNNWASYSNKKSFWLNKEDLLTSIKESGFNIVYEQKVGEAPFEYNINRGLFIGIK